MAAAALLSAALLLLGLLWRRLYRWPRHFPPGPPRLPVWGSYWRLLGRRRPPEALPRLAGPRPLLGLFLGAQPAAYVTAEPAIRRLLCAPEFQGRPPTILSHSRNFGRNLGVLLANEPSWRRHRRWSLRALRDLGFGRRFPRLEVETAAEVADLLELMVGSRQDQCVQRPYDGAVLFPDATYRCFAAVTWSIFAGARPGRAADRRLLELGHRGRQTILATDMTGNAIVLAPWLRHLPGRQFGLADFVEGHAALVDYVKETLDEHLATYSENHIRDFLDICIKEMKKDVADQEVPIDIEQVIVTGTDLLFPSLTVTTTALAEAVRCLVLHPEVQAKAQREIDRVVGRRRPPTLDDRPHLPYLEATIRETLRRKTAVPLGIAHMSLTETTLNGYTLPKGTILLPGIEAFHMNPDVWGDPENFRPERFLDETGELLPDRTLPFGAGRRECLGKTYSRNSLFLFLGGMLQSFTLRQPQSEKPLTLDGLCKYGLATTPDSFWVIAEQRPDVLCGN